MKGWTFLAAVVPLLALSSGMVVWALMRSILASFAGEDSTLATGVLVPASFVWLVLFITTLTAHIWTTRVPRGSVLPGTASLMGATAACAIVAATSPTDLGRVIGGVALLVSGACAWIGVVQALREIRRQDAENTRTADLRLHGTRVRGTVVDVRFPSLWQENEALFDVTVDYSTPSGTRRLTRTMHVPVASAPVVGGTVVIRFHGEGSNTDDVLMIEDAHSVRDPDSFAKYGGPPSR